MSVLKLLDLEYANGIFRFSSSDQKCLLLPCKIFWFWVPTLSLNCRSSRRKSPWSRRKRKRPLTPHQWRSLFTTEGKLRDGGVRFLKKVRSRVSLFERASNYVFDSHFSLYGYDMLLVGCWSKYSWRSVALLARSVSFLFVIVSSSFSTCNLLYLLQLWFE